VKIFFVRHGQTNYNVLGLCNDDISKDVHLTDLGKQQAETIQKKIKGVSLDLVITSEFPRARETASIIAKNQSVNFKIDPRLNDRKTGEFEGKPAVDFLDSLKKDKFNLKFENGESFLEEKQRVHEFLTELHNYNHQHILVVTHCEILQIINGYYNKLTDDEILNINIDNCQVLEIII